MLNHYKIGVEEGREYTVMGSCGKEYIMQRVGVEVEL